MDAISGPPWRAERNTFGRWRVVRRDGVTLWNEGVAEATESDARLAAASFFMLVDHAERLMDKYEGPAAAGMLVELYGVTTQSASEAVAEAEGRSTTTPPPAAAAADRE